MSGKRKHTADGKSSRLAKRQHRLAKLQRQLTRLNLATDSITRSAPRKWIYNMLLYLPLKALCSLVVTSKTWFILFSHDDFAFWKQLRARSGEGKFAFAAISLKPFFATHYYLCEFGVSYCQHCTMFSGGGEQDVVPISVYIESADQPGTYLCINPACRKPLAQRAGNVQLEELFPQCVKSSRKAEKDHTWKSLKRDLRFPNGEPVHDEYKYCTRCGLLKLHRAYIESDFCDGCFHQLKNCTCEPCVRCGWMPDKCNCTLCGDCSRCMGCDVCEAQGKRLCKCTFCDDCGGNLSQGLCECW